MSNAFSDTTFSDIKYGVEYTIETDHYSEIFMYREDPEGSVTLFRFLPEDNYNDSFKPHAEKILEDACGDFEGISPFFGSYKGLYQIGYSFNRNIQDLFSLEELEDKFHLVDAVRTAENRMHMYNIETNLSWPR